MRRAVVRTASLAVGTVGLALVAWAVVTFHTNRACILLDAPSQYFCGRHVGNSDAAYSELLSRQIARNPGDSAAWTALAVYETGTRQSSALRASMKLAPSDPNVLRLRADQAAKDGQWALALSLLVPMAERMSGDAAPILARLVATGQANALLGEHLVPGSKWFANVMYHLAVQKLRYEPALPLMAQAATKKLLPSDMVNAYVRELQNNGRFGDAYGLWLTQQRQPVPLLINGGFNERIQGGFDWILSQLPPSRAGAAAAQRERTGRGNVLEVQYTGRSISVPPVMQYLFIPPGKYVLRGQYMTERLNSEAGLAWSVRCPNAANADAGRSAALADTTGVWKDFQFEFVVPNNCGLVGTLQLETFAQFEAVSGLRGKVSFDAFELRAQPL